MLVVEDITVLEDLEKESKKKEALSQIKIQKLQEDLNQVFFQLGQLKANEIRLKKQEIFLNERLTSLEEQEKTIAKELTDKYGKGSLDIETGTFTPTE